MKIKSKRGKRNSIQVCLGICMGIILGFFANHQVTAAPSNGGADAEDFNILEILPHESASVFSYLVGGLEDSTPIGKEGLETLLGLEQGKDMFSAPNASFGDTRPFTKLVDYYQEDTLAKYLTGDIKNYSDLVTVGTDAPNRGKKWHVVKTGEMLTGQNGYFEYVGSHGLFQITEGYQQITTEYDYIKGGNYGIQNIVSFSPRAVNTPNGERKTTYDFDVSFVYNDRTKFDAIVSEGVYKFKTQNNAYVVAGTPTKNQESGEYYLKNENGKDIYVYAPDRTKLANADSLEFYDVWFKQQAGGTYYIEEIKTAKKKGEGNYLVRSDNWVTEIFFEVGNQKGIAERYISAIFPGALSCWDGEAALKAQKWVWVSVSGDDMKKSKYTDFTNPVRGTRIYVKNMTLPKAYYAKDGYANNEWGKLLMMEWDGYDKSKPAQTNVEQAKKEGILDAYNMQVTCRKPSEVTMADLERADLIYIASEAGFGSIKNYWKTLTGKDETIKDDFFGEDFKSFAYTQYLYEQYYKRQKAIILQVDVKDKVSKTSNLYKLFMMFGYFEDPDVFANFFDTLKRPTSSFRLQGNEEVKGNYTQIHNNGGLTIGSYSKYPYQNIQCPIAEGVSWAGSRSVSPTAEWNINYFTPRILEGNGNRPYDEYKSREETYDNITDKFTGKNYMFSGYWGAGFMSDIQVNFDIHQMLNFIIKPKIVFPNSDTVNGKDYLFVEDFQNLFYIDFRVYSKKKQIKKIDVVMENVNEKYVGLGTYETTPIYTKTFADLEKNYEENHLKGTNSGMKFQKNATGYSNNGSSIFFPKNLSAGMQRKAKVIVTYDTGGNGNTATIEKEITVVARDSFDLN